MADDPVSVSFADVAPPGPEIPAPPKREVPEVQDGGEAPAPPKRRGRPRKEDRARTTTDTKPAVKKAAPAKLTPKDFTADLTAVTDGLWLAGSQIPPAAPYAAILKANQAGLVASLNAAANQNATARAYVEKLSGGGNGSWMLQLGMVGVSMGMQAMQLARDPKLREQLVEQNSQAVASYLEKISGQMEQAQTAPEA